MGAKLFPKGLAESNGVILARGLIGSKGHKPSVPSVNVGTTAHTDRVFVMWGLRAAVRTRVLMVGRPAGFLLLATPGLLTRLARLVCTLVKPLFMMTVIVAPWVGTPIPTRCYTVAIGPSRCALELMASRVDMRSLVALGLVLVATSEADDGIAKKEVAAARMRMRGR